jgi:hypothetical protein
MSSRKEGCVMTTTALLQQTSRQELLENKEVSFTKGMTVERGDIMFGDVSPGKVLITVTVRNQGRVTSPPSPMFVQAAPLGAFVPWRPLAELRVPPIEPGRQRTVSFVAERSRHEPLGDPGVVEPARFLRAATRGSMMRRYRNASRVRLHGRLPVDLLELLQLGSIFWAGNINVFLGGREVERHFARQLCLNPSQPSLADFILGAGPDSYRFHVERKPQELEVALFDVTSQRRLGIDLSRSERVPEESWWHVPGTRVLFLTVDSTEESEVAVEIHVDQKSTGKSAVIELGFEASA